MVTYGGTWSSATYYESQTFVYYNGSGYTSILPSQAVEPTVTAGWASYWMLSVSQGNDGTDGTSATIAVGTVTTGAAGTNASVTNVGTDSAAIFDFTIPRGNDGGGSYTLPIATSTTLGGVMPATKTSAMTQNIGVDSVGALWTAPADLSGYLALAGGTLTGALILAAAPTADLGAATKSYVDSSISTAISGVDAALGSGVIS